MDELNKRLGKWGRYQIYVLGLLFIPSFLGGCHTLLSPFTMASQENRCFVAGVDNDSHSRYSTPFDNNLTSFLYTAGEMQAGKLAYCQYCPFNATNIDRNVTCSIEMARRCDDGRVYDTSQYHSTLSMQFDMVCEGAWHRELLRSVFMLGVLTGAAVFGVVSDRIGRKKTFVLCSLSEVLVFNAVPFALDYYAYALLQFMGAAAQYGTYLTGFIIAMEVMDDLPRTVAGVAIQGFFTVGYLYDGLAAYFIRHWKWLQFSVSILTLLYLPYYWLLPESIRWLLVNDKRDEAQKILDKACKMNRIPPFQLPRSEEVAKSEQANKASFFHLFKYRKLGVCTIVIFFTWFVCALTYYGLSLNTADLPGDEYVNFVLSGLFELPGLALCIPAMQKFGRKPTMVTLLAISGVACILSGTLPSSAHGWIVACATLGKLCIAGAFAVLYNYSAEIYPTVVRNSGTGFSSLFARVGSICAPQIHLLAYYVSHWVPIVIYGIFALLAALADLLLPETKGQALPETLEDTLRLTNMSSHCQKYTNPVHKDEPSGASSNAAC